MIGSGSRPRLGIHAIFAVLAVLLLARCSDGVHGTANASGSDRGSAGQIRLGLPF
jgi:hypothetical protein